MAIAPTYSYEQFVTVITGYDDEPVRAIDWNRIAEAIPTYTRKELIGYTKSLRTFSKRFLEIKLNKKTTVIVSDLLKLVNEFADAAGFREYSRSLDSIESSFDVDGLINEGVSVYKMTTEAELAAYIEESKGFRNFGDFKFSKSFTESKHRILADIIYWLHDGDNIHWLLRRAFPPPTGYPLNVAYRTYRFAKETRKMSVRTGKYALVNKPKQYEEVVESAARPDYVPGDNDGKTTAVPDKPVITENRESCLDTRKAVPLSKTIESFKVKYRPVGEKQPVERVAKYEAENCVINILRSYLGDGADKIYKRYPALKPNGTDPVYIDSAMLSKIVKTAKVIIKTYTAIGNRLDQPWETFGAGKRKTIHIVIEDEHANVRLQSFTISAIVYHQNDFKLPSTTNIVERGYDADGERLEYYCTLEDGKVSLHKRYRPSFTTGDEADDENLQYAYITTPASMMYRIFRTQYGLTTPIANKEILELVVGCEHFVSRARFGDLYAHHVEVDHNKSYCSGEFSKYYQGYPSTRLSFVEPEHAQSPAFVYAERVTNAPECFKMLYKYKSGPICLAWPMVRFLQDAGAVVDIKYCLEGEFQHVSILDFAASMKRVPDDDLKFFRNSLIGRTISGGVNQTRPITAYYSNPSELESMIADCNAAEIDFQLSDMRNTITAHLPVKRSGHYHFHSYILAYSACAIMQKMIDLTQHGAKVLAYNVDAIVVDKLIGHVDAQEPGGWKRGPVKEYYSRYRIDDQLYEERAPLDISPVVPVGPVYIKNTFISGPGGIGKSHPFLTNPAHNQVIITPTIDLRDRHLAFAKCDVMTAAKYIQFGYDERKFHMTKTCRYTTVVVDEATMFDSSQWKLILERAGGIVIALGDFCQIRSAICADPITPEYFAGAGFDIIELKRTPEMRCRHSFEFGTKLDGLRGLSIGEQRDYICANFKLSLPADYQETDTMIIGNHARAKEINDRVFADAARQSKRFPVRKLAVRKKATIETEYRLADDELKRTVWFDKLKCAERAPPGLEYEPRYALTCDSYQGQTAENRVIIDIGSLGGRHGLLYTALTRVREESQLYFVRAD